MRSFPFTLRFIIAPNYSEEKTTSMPMTPHKAVHERQEDLAEAAFEGLHSRYSCDWSFRKEPGLEL
jgi:hypothetical protein